MMIHLDVSRINDALVDPRPIGLAGDAGLVYVVDKAFTNHQAVGEALKQIPASQTPWGPAGNNAPAVETQTVVVDLIAEYLNSQKH